MHNKVKYLFLSGFWISSLTNELSVSERHWNSSQSKIFYRIKFNNILELADIVEISTLLYDKCIMPTNTNNSKKSSSNSMKSHKRIKSSSLSTQSLRETSNSTVIRKSPLHCPNDKVWSSDKHWNGTAGSNPSHIDHSDWSFFLVSLSQQANAEMVPYNMVADTLPVLLLRTE